jgi:hypothetical protein
MADTYLAITGLYALGGQTVTAWIGGLNCGNYVVDVTGTINVLFGADSGGLCTPQYLASLSPYTGENAVVASFDAGTGTLSYTVPIVVGLAFNADGQGVRAVTTEDTKTPTGPSLGETRRGDQFGLLLSNTVNLQVGTNTGNLQSETMKQADLLTDLAATSMFSGVRWDILPGDYTYDGMIYWRQAGPEPATVCAYTVFLDTEPR